MLLAVGHFHYVADYLYTYPFTLPNSCTEMQGPTMYKSHTHTHTIPAVVVMRESLVLWGGRVLTDFHQGTGCP